jgi:hypothetical protein
MKDACDIAGPRGFSETRWLELIRSEYREMPDLHLTPAQMQRLWGIGPDTCGAVIEALVAQRALKLTLTGAYTRLRVTN